MISAHQGAETVGSSLREASWAASALIIRIKVDLHTPTPGCRSGSPVGSGAMLTPLTRVTRQWWQPREVSQGASAGIAKSCALIPWKNLLLTNRCLWACASLFAGKSEATKGAWQLLPEEMASSASCPGWVPANHSCFHHAPALPPPRPSPFYHFHWLT